MRKSKGIFKNFVVLMLILALSGAGMPVHAQVVDRDVLERSLGPVTFINFEGPHAHIDTLEQIRQIGVGVGQVISGGAVRAGALNRYFALHLVSGPEGDKLDAAIFGIGSDARVDHIRNVRVILQGYLQSAYNYSASDALLLAEFITIYNAVYRGDWEHFVERYKTLVIENLVPEMAGISVRYDEWPGRTLMVIPLITIIEDRVDAGAIANDERILAEMREREDMGIPQRQDMVDLLEREAQEAERLAIAERERIREEEERIARERAEIEQERQQIAQEGAGIGQERQEITQEQQQIQQGQPPQEDLDVQQRLEELEERLLELEQREQELDQREQELDEMERQLLEEEAALEDGRELADMLEEHAEIRGEQAQQGRETIAEDQQLLLEQAAAQPGIITSIIERQGMGRVIRIDPYTGEILRQSPVSTVRVRTLSIVNNRLLAIAGENVGAGAVRLVEINAGDLTMARQGGDDIHPESLLWVNGSDIYAITVEIGSNNHYMGRFNSELVLQARSEIPIHPYAKVMIHQGRLFTQRADGSPAILDPASLIESLLVD